MTREKARGVEGREPTQNFIHEYVRQRFKTTALLNLDAIANHEH